MFRRILIPTDFSTASEWVFDDAVRIAGASGAELIILHVRMTRTSHPDELRFPADPSLYEYAEQQELDRLRDRVRRANASLSTRLIVRQAPDPGEEICRRREGGSGGPDRDRHACAASRRAPVRRLDHAVRARRSALSRPRDPLRHPQTRSRCTARSCRCISSRPRTRRSSSRRAWREEVHLVIVCDEDDTARAEELLRELAAPLRNATDGASCRAATRTRRSSATPRSTDADAIFLNAARQPSEGKLDIVRHATVPVMIVP